MSEYCPFCGHDPYHYVDNGVGMERVAVTCCELGVELFDHRNTGDVTMSREEFTEIVGKLANGRRATEALEFIRDGYDNQDVNHVDFRVKAYQVAIGVLDDVGGARE